MVSAENVLFPPLVDPQSGKLGLAQHPSECNLRKLALFFCIASADVRVHASKPDFLYILGGIVRCPKQVLPKECATFVDRNCMTNNSHVGILTSVDERKPDRIINPSNRAD